MTNKLIVCIGVAVLAVFSSCDKFNSKEKVEDRGKLLASVGESKLFADDVAGLVNNTTPIDDSIQITKTFIEGWIKRHVIVDEARQSIDLNEAELKTQLKNYEESIIKYHYERQILQNRIDTSISETAINNYYLQNKENFKLRSNIVQALFIKIPKKVSFIDDMRGWIFDFEEESRYPLNLHATQYAVSYSINDSAWNTLDYFLRQLPESVAEEKLIGNNKQIEMEDSVNIYFLNVLQYEKKGNIAPMSFVQKDIFDIIINKRKLELINEIYENIYQDALKEGSFKTYYDE